MQYSKAFTDALQFAWGAGFLSPGGPEEVAEMVAGHDLKGARILDVGSGLGGVDLLLVDTHGAGEVVGIDVEAQLVEAARRLISDRNLAHRITFQLVEPGPLPFPDSDFDMVFTKDALVHVEDKPAMYREVLRVLKPGGWFVAADWLWGEGAATSKVVRDWLATGPLSFAYTTPPQAHAALLAAGFTDVAIADRRHLLQASNRREVAMFEGPARQELAEIVGEQMANARLASARGRQAALDSGDLIPSHLRGRKPS